VVAGGEQAGVDGPGDGRADLDNRHDGDAEHFCYVGGRQATARFGHKDHPVGGRAGSSDQTGHGQVARSTQHGVVLAHVALSSDRGAHAGVDDQDLVVIGRAVGEPELGGDLDIHVRRPGRSNPQQGGHGMRVGGGENGGPVAGGKQGDGGRHGRRPLPTPGAGEGDRSSRHGSPSL
jgi:hypothetical protein